MAVNVNTSDLATGQSARTDMLHRYGTANAHRWPRVQERNAQFGKHLVPLLRRSFEQRCHSLSRSSLGRISRAIGYLTHAASQGDNHNRSRPVVDERWCTSCSRLQSILASHLHYIVIRWLIWADLTRLYRTCASLVTTGHDPHGPLTLRDERTECILGALSVSC